MHPLPRGFESCPSLAGLGTALRFISLSCNSLRVSSGRAGGPVGPQGNAHREVLHRVTLPVSSFRSFLSIFSYPFSVTSSPFTFHHFPVSPVGPGSLGWAARAVRRAVLGSTAFFPLQQYRPLVPPGRCLLHARVMLSALDGCVRCGPSATCCCIFCTVEKAHGCFWLDTV